MAKQNTGYARMKTLTVTQGSYTHSYNITDTFATPRGVVYQTLTNTEFAQLSEEDYSQRLLAFQEYVYDQETGLSDDCPDLTPGSMVFDPDTCPINLQEQIEY